MMKETEIAAMMKAVADVVREYVGVARDALTDRINDLDSKIKAIPDVEKLIEGVHDYIGRALAPFAIRIKALEDRAPERGEKGDRGEKGEPGDSIRGEKGEKGDTGPAGERGADGLRGNDGKDGSQGVAGVDGLPGKSAYQLAVERGFGGTELQWLDSLTGKPGRDGINGKDAESVDVAAIAREAAALVPIPKDGKQGPAGKDVDPALLNDAIDRKVADAVSKLPTPKDGHDGAPGANGEPGRDGKDADPAIIASMVAEGIAQALPGAVQKAIDAMMPELIAKAAAAVPRPLDGKDGADGRDGRDAEPIDMDAVVKQAIELIPVPKDGVDGKSVTLDDLRPILEAETARWQLEFERRAAEVVQRFLEKVRMPEDGKDGKDAAQLETFDAALEGRILKLSLTAGERIVGKDIRLPIPIDKGVYRSGYSYEQSDTVTYSGAVWIALRDTTTKPPSADWRLCVARGRDGKDAAP